ncbi:MULTISPECIES: hypothetical protein [unclassified Microbacterium]|nr:hypothetical protein [Microbacterium sp. MAH-37]
MIGHAATALAEAGVDAQTIGEAAGALMPLRTQVVAGEGTAS